MLTRRWIHLFIVTIAIVPAGWTFFHLRVGTDLSRTADQFLTAMDESQRAKIVHKYDAPERLDWHFIPKGTRKGLQIKEMNEDQRKAAHRLLRGCLSEVGYKKATTIMQLEHILHQLEGGGGSNIRDTERYYFSIFGQPSEQGRWGLSIEGHHLSLNFVVEGGEVIASTPAFFASNPAIVKDQVDHGKPVGTRVINKEEELAFQLVNSLSDDQKGKAIIADKAPDEIRGAGAPQPPQEEAVGLSLAELEQGQRQTMKGLVMSYLDNLPEEIADRHRSALVDAGTEKIHFAWAGATEPGIGHYYRIQGPTFLIEFVNTQPDPSGNIANHIHCVLRDMRGDFALPIAH
jgi:hypothetical protein